MSLFRFKPRSRCNSTFLDVFQRLVFCFGLFWSVFLGWVDALAFTSAITSFFVSCDHITCAGVTLEHEESGRTLGVPMSLGEANGVMIYLLGEAVSSL